jgi:hypothetical protein
VTAFWVGIGVMIEKVALKLIPSLAETRKAFREAREDFERGDAWTQRAKADLAPRSSSGRASARSSRSSTRRWTSGGRRTLRAA